MPALPTKKFDVRNLNGSVDADATAYPRATGIIYKDNAAKDEVIEAIAANHNYDAMVADPKPTKQQFFNQWLQSTIKDEVKKARLAAQQKAIQPIDEADLP